MSAAPAVVNDVFELVGDDATVAFAPGSIDLLGEDCHTSGGMLLASALPVYAAVAIEEIADPELVVEYQRQRHAMPMPDAIPEAFPPIPTAVAATLVALQHSLHLVPRNDGGLKVTIKSTIPASRGFGDIPAIQCALALALNNRFGDRDDVPTRARIATAIHELMRTHMGDEWPLHPYTVSLRSRPESLLCINHSDDAVTQTTRPNSLSLLVAYSPDVTAGSPLTERHAFFCSACGAFGVPTLAELPDSQSRIVDWVKARHEVQPDCDAPTVSRANQWLEEADASSDRARAVIGHIRHSNIDAAIAGVNRDVEQRDSAPVSGSALGDIVAGTAKAGDKIASRCCPAPAAAVVVWSRSELTDLLNDVIEEAGGRTIRISGTDAGAVVE